MVSPDREVEKISEDSFLLRFDDGGEVWAKVTKSRPFLETGRRFLPLSDKGFYPTMGVLVDVNRMILAAYQYERLMSELCRFAEEHELPRPSIQPGFRIKTDWPALLEERIPEVMLKVLEVLETFSDPPLGKSS